MTALLALVGVGGIAGWAWALVAHARTERSRKELAEARAHASQAMSDVEAIKRSANAWRERADRLSRIVLNRDAELARLADELDRCSDPRTLGQSLRERLRIAPPAVKPSAPARR